MASGTFRELGQPSEKIRVQGRARSPFSEKHPAYLPTNSDATFPQTTETKQSTIRPYPVGARTQLYVHTSGWGTGPVDAASSPGSDIDTVLGTMTGMPFEPSIPEKKPMSRQAGKKRTSSVSGSRVQGSIYNYLRTGRTG